MLPDNTGDLPSIPDIGGGWFSNIFEWFTTFSQIISNLYQHVTHHVSEFINIIDDAFQFLSSVSTWIPTELVTLAVALISVSIIYAIIKR